MFFFQSPMFDGKMTLWHHFSCFFKKQRPKTVGDISHFESLRWEDQEKIRQKVEAVAGIYKFCFCTVENLPFCNDVFIY